MVGAAFDNPTGPQVLDLARLPNLRVLKAADRIGPLEKKSEEQGPKSHWAMQQSTPINFFSYMPAGLECTREPSG